MNNTSDICKCFQTSCFSRNNSRLNVLNFEYNDTDRINIKLLGNFLTRLIEPVICFLKSIRYNEYR